MLPIDSHLTQVENYISNSIHYDDHFSNRFRVVPCFHAVLLFIKILNYKLGFA